jgi:hypothetical protein
LESKAAVEKREEQRQGTEGSTHRSNDTHTEFEFFSFFEITSLQDRKEKNKPTHIFPTNKEAVGWL